MFAYIYVPEIHISQLWATELLIVPETHITYTLEVLNTPTIITIDIDRLIVKPLSQWIWSSTCPWIPFVY